MWKKIQVKKNKNFDFKQHTIKTYNNEELIIINQYEV